MLFNTSVLSCALTIVTMLGHISVQAQKSDPVQLSKSFLQTIKDGGDTRSIKEQLSAYTLDELQKMLVSDEQKFAFWINIYNGYIQDILSSQPELYEDRRTFFKEPYIDMVGRRLAFADIEHGIIRKSAMELFLGYLTNPLAPKWEKKLRVSERDFRIHFALNCGAKSCPPVTIYDDNTLNEQLDYMTTKYLKETTDYDASMDQAEVVALFSWFRGDFGGGDGIRDILVDYKATPSRPDKVITKEYDWTLDLDNWR